MGVSRRRPARCDDRERRRGQGRLLICADGIAPVLGRVVLWESATGSTATSAWIPCRATASTSAIRPRALITPCSQVMWYTARYGIAPGCSGCFREARARPPRLASPCSNAPPTRADSWCPHLTGAGAAEVRREGSRFPSLGGHPRQADGPWRRPLECGEHRGEPVQVRRDRARPVTGGIRTGLDLPQSPGEDFVERIAAEAGCTRSSTARGVPAGHARRSRYGSRRPSR